ncbi:integrase [Methanofollis ethanolicus]|uniref:integrase n=1 Tax=Methanofollis ethanolicus TaxID=488124 RepID=UPI00082BF0FC|nr:integrase [Methanofollis ethanolicus]
MADADVGKRFLEYAAKTRTKDDKTRRGYLNGLRSLQPIKIPTDLSDYKEMYGTNITDPQRKGLQKFFNFLRDKELRTEWNGYDLSLFWGNLKIAEKGEANMSSRLKDLTSAEVQAAREGLPEPVQVYYSLLAYSGARHSHLYKALEQSRSIERVGNAIRIDVKDLSGGTKNEAYFYFPAEMEKALSQYSHSHSGSHLQKLIAASGTEGRPVNVASLRKWNYNLMRTGDPVIDATAADHIQGRSPKSVGDRHYADLDKIAAEGYNAIVPKLLQDLPVPDWMTDYAPARAGKPKSKGGRENLIAGKNKKEMDEKELDRMLRSGMSHAEIIKQLPGANKTKIAAYVKEHPELKRK